LVIIEDAHQRPDELAAIIRALRRERPGAVLVVSTRPSGTTVLRGKFRQLRVDDARVSTWKLGELSTQDASRLAEQALGEAKRHLARRLAATVGDSPFLLVFSALEIARGRRRLGGEGPAVRVIRDGRDLGDVDTAVISQTSIRTWTAGSSR
ncbi:hypothetical protein, partial [Streptomyces exfoliatus]